MMTFTKVAAVAAIALAGFSGAAQAATVGLTIDTDFVEFNFGASTWDDEFTFTITDTAYLLVTDIYVSGDMFEVSANGSSLGETSAVPAGAGLYESNPYIALFSDDFSSAVFELAAGSYTISGLVSQAATGFTSGAGAVKLSSFDITAAVPVPAAGLMLLSALGGFAGLRRKRKA
ncbi:MAG: VPLPA-CTERM sorting domain-containing protein [Rhodobacteraceae bacterium]|nr:VPLPA-CTERM sorting domain-containing protein [Paracoccaceae bacterium]